MTKLEQNFSESLRFLKWLYPNGPWFLVAIRYSKTGALPSRKFRPGQEGEMLAWLDEHSDKNLYYHVNLAADHVSDKHAAKSEIAQVRFLQIDCDLRVGEDPETGRARVTAAVEKYTRRPSALIYSGGGVNALWRLDREIEMIAGAEGEPLLENIEGRNKQLAADLEGDNCHDISRILRLPGTINRLNKDKVSRGRVPSESSIIWLEPTTYDFVTFACSPLSPRNQTTSSSRVSTDVERTESIDSLSGKGGDVPERVKIIISQGHDPDKAWNGDRSSALHFVCCELIRCGVPDRVILGIITDSRYRISESVLDKGSRVSAYALRQIQRAKEKAFDPKLLEMNDRYAVIEDYGGHCMVMITDRDNPRKFRFQRPREFAMGRDNEKKVWKHPLKPDKDVILGVGSWWLDQRMRRQYEHVVFEPGVDTPGDLNLWQGFAVEPRLGDLHRGYLDHVFVNICCGNQERYEYLVKWMARVVQHPNTQSGVAVVLLGSRGTGKSFFANQFAKIFGIGQHAFVASDDRLITGRFNSHLSAIVLLLAEEAFDIRDKRHESVLKELITGEALAVERKGVDVSQMRNYVHLIMTSNNEKVIPAGDHERRFLVLRVGESVRQSTEYFGQLAQSMKSGGLENLLHHLLSIDLTGFDVFKIPTTAELREQQDHNLSREDDWLWSRLEAGSWLSSSFDSSMRARTARISWTGPVIKEILYQEYLGAMTSLNVGRPMSSRQFTKWLKRALPGTTDKQMSPLPDGSRPWMFVFQDLEKCRSAFAAQRGRLDYEWPETIEDDGVRNPEIFS